MELKVQTFGPAEVWLAGAPVHWSAQAAKQLFFYLLSFPEGRRKEQILEDLWQTEASEAVSNRFRVTMHRLRQALGRSDAVQEIHQRYRLAEAVLQVSDVYVFYQILEISQQATTDTERLSALQRALALYRGEYLADFSETWVEDARSEHQTTYVRALLELSMLHCQHRSCDASVSALVRALRADPFVGEHYHQRLMTCLSTVEDKYAAIEHYRRFLHFLRHELGDAPMHETTDIAERIKQGEQICDNMPLPQREHCIDCLPPQLQRINE